MKKLMTVLLGVLMIAGVTNALTTDSGQIAATIASTTDFGTPTYPTAIGLAPAVISDGTGVTDVPVVQNLVINDNSVAGWTLDIVATNGNLEHTVTADPIAYSLSMGAAGGTLGTGLSIGATTPLTLGAGAIDATGTATTATVDYTFDILVTIADAATVGKLAGNYAETLTLTISSND